MVGFGFLSTAQTADLSLLSLGSEMSREMNTRSLCISQIAHVRSYNALAARQRLVLILCLVVCHVNGTPIREFTAACCGVPREQLAVLEAT